MDEEEEIGNVFNFFAKPSVAAINITSGELRVGDTIRIKGETTDITQKIESMEIDSQGVGIKVPERVRPHDKVYKIKVE
jgi:hypothetical protein